MCVCVREREREREERGREKERNFLYLWHHLFHCNINDRNLENLSVVDFDRGAKPPRGRSLNTRTKELRKQK